MKEICDWSKSNSNHLPVYIYIDVKGAYYRGCNGLAKLFGCGNFSSSSSSSTCPEYVHLDDLISSVFSSSHMFRPCDVVCHGKNVDGGLKSRFKSWPVSSALRGKVFFVLNTTFGQRGSYDQLRQGANMFRRCIGVDDDDALFYETRDMSLAQKYLRQGF